MFFPLLWLELVFTFIFIVIVLGSTGKGAPVGFAGLAIGLALVLIHIVCIPVTGTSVNPARSIAPAVFAGGRGVVATLAVYRRSFLGSCLCCRVMEIFGKSR